MFLPLHRRRSTLAFTKKAGRGQQAFSSESRHCFLKETDDLPRTDKEFVRGSRLPAGRMVRPEQKCDPGRGGVHNNSLGKTRNIDPVSGIDRYSRPGSSSIRSAQMLLSNEVRFSLRSFPPCLRNAGREEFGIFHRGFTVGLAAALQPDERSGRVGICFRNLSGITGTHAQDSAFCGVSFVHVQRSASGALRRGRTKTVLTQTYSSESNGNRGLEYSVRLFNSKIGRRYA